jgi:hypothetical protein
LNTPGKGGQYPRDPYDWYREPPSAVAPLFDAIDFRDDLIFDPSCGGGNILDVAKSRGHATFGADIVDRYPRHKFQRGNFLMASRFPTPHDRALSVVNNPPYNYEDGIGLRFILKTLDDVPFRLAAFLMPIEFACGQDRYRDLYSRRPPAYVAFLSERPSMPPGAAVLDMGDEAYRNGMADYLWLVWRAGPPCLTQALFLAPSKAPKPPSERRLRRGSQTPSVSA